MTTKEAKAIDKLECLESILAGYEITQFADDYSDSLRLAIKTIINSHAQQTAEIERLKAERDKLIEMWPDNRNGGCDVRECSRTGEWDGHIAVDTEDEHVTMTFGSKADAVRYAAGLKEGGANGD